MSNEKVQQYENYFYSKKYFIPGATFGGLNGTYRVEGSTFECV